MKIKIILCFSSLFLFACEGTPEEESTTVSEAIAIGKEIKGIHEDFSEKMKESDSAFNESIKSIHQQLENRGKGIKRFELDSTIKEVNFKVENYKE